MRPETIALIALSVAMAFFSYAINKKIGKRDRVKELQAKINAFQKELKEAHAKGDEERVKKLQKREPEVMKAMQEMMMLPWRSLIIIGPVYLLLYAFVLPSLFLDYVVRLPFGLNLPGAITFWDAAVWRNWFGARGFFIWCTVFSGLVIVEGIWVRLEKKIFAKKESPPKKESPQAPSENAGENA